MGLLIKGRRKWPGALIVILVAVASLVPWGSAGAIGEPLLTINQVKSEGFPTVVAYVTVSDQSGIPIIGLSKANFEAFEDGKAVPNLAVSTAVDSQEGIAAILAIDTSGSMKGQPIKDAKEAAKVFVGDLSANDRAAIIGFSAKVDLLQDYTGVKADLNSAIEALTAEGNTVLYDAIYDAVGHASRLPPGRKMILILTDGEDTESSVTLDDAISRARELNVPVFAIGLGKIVADPLKRLTKLTGGRYLEAPSSAELTGAFKLVSDQLRHQYVVSYRSQALPDGQEHTLVVKVTYQGEISQDSRTFIATPVRPSIALPGLTDGMEVAGIVEIAPDIQPPDFVAQVEYSLDDAVIATVDQAPFSYQWDTSGIGLGEHTLAVTVRDQAGNEAQMTVRLRVVPLLEVEITSPLEGEEVAGQVMVEPSITAFHQVASVEYLLDGKPLATVDQAPFGYRWDTSGVSLGEHTLAATVRDQAGNEAQAMVGLQVVPLLEVEVLSPLEGADVVGQVTVEPSITAFHQVASVEYLLDGKPLATVDQAPFGYRWDTSGVALGEHTLAVTVRDQAGNESQTTVGLRVVPLLEVEIASPLEGAEVAGQVTVEPSITAFHQVASVEYLLDGKPLATVDQAPFGYRWDTSGVALGEHTLAVTVRDQAGNEAQTAVTLRVVPLLEVEIVSPLEGAEVAGQVTVEPSITAFHQVASVEYLLDGKPLATVDQAPFSYQWNPAGVTAGQHTLMLRVHDSEGNTAEAVRRVQVVVPLAVRITSPAAGTEIEGIVTLSVAVTPVGAAERVEYLLDGQSLAQVEETPFSYQWDPGGVKAGSHILTAKAYGAGQTDQDQVEVTVVPPTLPWGVIFALAAIVAAAIPLLLAAKRRRPTPVPSAVAPTREIAAPPRPERRPQGWLVEKGGEGRRWQLQAGETLIGREVGPEDLLIDDPLASRQHARVKFEAGALVFYDLGSTNPSLINGVEYRGPHRLREGDEVTIGDTTLVFKTGQ